jgi:peptide/nickel transport system permease protein
MLIGVPIGLFAGWREGWLSEFLMRTTDVFLAVPQLILALALGQLLAPGIGAAMVALALTYWPFFARTVFAETRRLRGSLFVDALAGLGASPLRILFLHILPNAAPAVLVRATIGMGFTILTAAILGFLGVGATPPSPDWGLAVSEARQHLPEAWWFPTFPGLAILVLVLGFNLLGDGLRDAADPKIRRSKR